LNKLLEHGIGRKPDSRVSPLAHHLKKGPISDGSMNPVPRLAAHHRSETPIDA